MGNGITHMNPSIVVSDGKTAPAEEPENPSPSLVSLDAYLDATLGFSRCYKLESLVEHK